MGECPRKHQSSNFMVDKEIVYYYITIHKYKLTHMKQFVKVVKALSEANGLNIENASA